MGHVIWPASRSFLPAATERVPSVSAPSAPMPSTADLSRYAYRAIAAAIVAIPLKVIDWRLTGSVGLLSGQSDIRFNA